MREESMQFAKSELNRTIRMTNDQNFINRIWQFTQNYFIKNPENLGPEFWDRKDTEINMYNVKQKLIENIEMLPEDYICDLKYLHRLYGITKCQLEEVANRREDEAGLLL